MLFSFFQFFMVLIAEQCVCQLNLVLERCFNIAKRETFYLTGSLSICDTYSISHQVLAWPW